MEYRILGKTGVRVSAIGVGTWQLSGPMTLEGKPDGYPEIGADQAVRLILQCGDLGMNLVDTAPIYGDGEGERRVGRAIARQRDRWIIATKFGMERGPDGARVRRDDAQSIVQSLERSLQRLGTDRVDLFMHHSPIELADRDEKVATLERLKQQGKARFVGVSTNSAAIAKALARDVDVVLFSQSLLTRPRGMQRLVERQGLGGLVRGVFEAGRLSGRYFTAPTLFGSDDVRFQRPDRGAYGRFAALQEHVPHGVSMAALALRYVLDFPSTHAAILGGRSLEDYRTAMEALAMPPLTAEARAALERHAAALDPSARARPIARRALRSAVDALARRLGRAAANIS